MSTTLPPVSLWEQFYVVGIIVLTILVFGAVGRMLFRDFTRWMAEQDKKRDDERNTQRQWMEQQTTASERERQVREDEWQKFFRSINNDNQAAIYRLVEVNTKLVERIEAMTRTLEAHDSYVHRKLEDEQSDGNHRQPTRRVK